MEAVTVQSPLVKSTLRRGRMRLLAVMCGFLLVAISPTTFAAAKIKPDIILQAKNYLFAACMINSYKGEAIAVEAEVWAGGLVENGTLSAANYVALAELAKTAPAPGVAQQGVVMRLQNCMEFAHSAKIMERAVKVLRH